MTCKECVHYEVCEDKLFKNTDKACEKQFISKSRFEEMENELDDLKRDTVPKLQAALQRANKYGRELEEKLKTDNGLLLTINGSPGYFPKDFIIEAVTEKLAKPKPTMLINLWVKDKASGYIHQVGTDVHDSVEFLGGEVKYINMQSCSGTPEEYEWVEPPDTDDYILVTPDELRLNREMIHKDVLKLISEKQFNQIFEDESGE